MADAADKDGDLGALLFAAKIQTLREFEPKLAFALFHTEP